MISINPSEMKECLPYDNIEFGKAMQRLLTHPLLPEMVKKLLPDLPVQEFLKLGQKVETVENFQSAIISRVIHSLLKLTCRGLSTSGFESLSKDQRYLLLSNHRDIICDPSLLTNCLHLEGHRTPKICLGDNLLVNSLVKDLVKMNKGLIVKRNLPVRELLKCSIGLSEILHQQIEEKIDSVWLAQREGRAKDGNDETHPGILKMLALAGQGNLIDRLFSLHIVPVAISYEFDPCDLLKAHELFFTKQNKTYQKEKDEDLISMTTGILGFKGRIHVSIGEEITETLEQARKLDSKKNQLEFIAKTISRKIHLNYKNWPSNYIAFDLLEGKDRMKSFYSATEKDEFLTRMKKKMTDLRIKQSEFDAIQIYFLKIYANPVANAIQA